MPDTTPKTTKLGDLRKTSITPDKGYWRRVAKNLKKLGRNDLLKGTEFYEEPDQKKEPQKEDVK